jgi:hypothetical protein
VPPVDERVWRRLPLLRSSPATRTCSAGGRPAGRLDGRILHVFLEGQDHPTLAVTEVPVAERPPLLSAYKREYGRMPTVAAVLRELPDSADHPVFRIVTTGRRPSAEWRRVGLRHRVGTRHVRRVAVAGEASSRCTARTPHRPRLWRPWRRRRSRVAKGVVLTRPTASSPTRRSRRCRCSHRWRSWRFLGSPPGRGLRRPSGATSARASPVRSRAADARCSCHPLPGDSLARGALRFGAADWSSPQGHERDRGRASRRPAGGRWHLGQVRADAVGAQRSRSGDDRARALKPARRR